MCQVAGADSGTSDPRITRPIQRRSQANTEMSREAIGAAVESPRGRQMTLRVLCGFTCRHGTTTGETTARDCSMVSPLVGGRGLL